MKTYKYLKYLLLAYIPGMIINFIFFDDFNILSTRLHAVESILLLIFSLTYLLNLIVEEDTQLQLALPALLICTGIGLYESISFLYYLFFSKVVEEAYYFSYKLFQLSQYVLIVYWFLFGFAFYFNRIKREPVLKKVTVDEH